MTGPGNEPMTQWQKFALLIFAILVIGAVVFVYMSINGSLNRMIG